MRRRTAAALEECPCSRYSYLCRRPEPAHVSISVTVDYVIVHHADRLHVRVDDRRSDEAESAVLEIAAERVRFGGRCGNLTRRIPPILPRPAIDELPAVRVKASVFFLHSQKRSRVLHRSGDLQPVSDDPWLGGEPVNPSRRISRYFLRIALAECAAVAIAFLEHNRPAQACLRGFENEEFKMGTVIVGWHAPFAIVILAHQRIVDIHPGTPFRLRTRH